MAVTVTILIAWYYTIQGIEYYHLKLELADLEAEYRQVRPAQDLERRLQATQKQLQEHKQLVEAYRSRIGLKVALDVLNQSVPAGVNLEAYVLGQDAQVQVTGNARSLTDVANFVSRLKASGVYKSVNAAFPGPFAAGALTEPVGSPKSDPKGAAPQSPGADMIRFQLNGALSER